MPTPLQTSYMTDAIYLDGFASQPLAPEARAAMLRAWDLPGNPSSPHSAGERAARIIEHARTELAALIGAAPSEIIFTSGATEANNLAILGAARAARSAGGKRSKIVVSAIEHKAVLEPAAALRAEGFEIALATVDGFGRLDTEALEALVDEETLLVSVMAANNETGVIQPIDRAAAIARRAGALFHSDAAQAAGKIRLDVQEIGADYASLSAHKMYGPMGIGALYVSASAPSLAPLLFGGGHQGGARPGTEPVALIAGFGAVGTAAAARLGEESVSAAHRVDRLLAGLAERQVRFDRITGSHPVIPGSAAIALPGVDAEDLCLRLGREVFISTGSACTSGQLRSSHVLEAMGFSEQKTGEVVRLNCGRFVSDDDLELAAEKIARALQ